MHRVSAALALSAVLLAGCLPVSAPAPSPSPTPSAAPVDGGGIGAPACAPAIPSGVRASLALTELPHKVESLIVFGLDGAFVASAGAYPLGASRRWWALDRDGRELKRFDWALELAHLQSPDGSKVVYGGKDPVSGKRGLFVREISGTDRFLVASDRPAFRWLDADRVLVDSIEEPGVIREVDTRTGSERIVFRPPTPPVPKSDARDDDWFLLSGDLRWAVLHRWNAEGALLRRDLFDVQRQTYVVGASPMSVTTATSDPLWLAPYGDLAVWVDGAEVRAMHLCDRRVTTIGRITAGPERPTQPAWSPDGRLLSLSLGETFDNQGPRRIVVVDIQRGAIAELTSPWGFIRQWSPDGTVVVLGRRGFHTMPTRLATFQFR